MRSSRRFSRSDPDFRDRLLAHQGISPERVHVVGAGVKNYL